MRPAGFALLIALAMFGVAVLVLAVTLWIVVFRRFSGEGIRRDRAAERLEERRRCGAIARESPRFDLGL